MIEKNNKEIDSVYIGDRPIDAIYLGDILVWEAISSNFFTKEGYYIQTKDNLIFNVNGKEESI